MTLCDMIIWKVECEYVNARLGLSRGGSQRHRRSGQDGVDTLRHGKRQGECDIIRKR